MYRFIKQLNADIANSDVAGKIEAIEKKYGITFPPVWKDFMLACDGSKINVCTFQVDGCLCEVSKIVPVCGSGLTFEKIVDNDRADGFIDENYYPIASNRGGDLYYWDAKSGSIYLIFPDDIENPFKISQSVDVFFTLLS